MKAQVSQPRLDQPFVSGSLSTAAGVVPQVAATLRWPDRWGTVKARWGVGRMHYTIDPGLYALHEPSGTSPVLVTANYKMSFDRLRECLPGEDAWILVLDTAGINVWCAAGKGTFGTEELVGRIQSSRLGEVVEHRRLILPQLSAPGVAAHKVKRLSGFSVDYGPIRASDLPAYLRSGGKATPEMRRKTFPLRERVALIPIELIAGLRSAFFVLVALVFLSGFHGSQGYWANALRWGSWALTCFLSGIAAGAVVTPIALPWLPGRAFALKGAIAGLLACGLLLPWHGWQLWGDRLDSLAWLLVLPAVSSYLGLNFTGASTYTSLSGVKKEMRWALPLQIGAAAAGALLWLAALVVS